MHPDPAGNLGEAGARKNRFAWALRESLTTALEDMFFVEEIAPCEGQVETSASEEIAARVEFTGSPSGALILRTDAATAQSLALNFLGEEEDALDYRQCSAVFAELANMVCGGVLTRTEPDCIFRLSTPAVAAENPVSAPRDSACGLDYAVKLDTGTVTATLWIEEAA